MQDLAGVRVREPVQHVLDHPQLRVHAEGELRVGQVQQQRARPDILEDQDVLALVFIGEEVPAGDDARVRRQPQQHVVRVGERDPLRRPHVRRLVGVGVIDAQQHRRRAGRVGVPRPVLRDLLGLAEGLDDLPVPEAERPGAGLGDPGDLSDDLVAVLADVPEKGRPDAFRPAELGHQVVKPDDDVLRVRVGSGRPVDEPDIRRRASRPGHRRRPGQGPSASGCL